MHILDKPLEIERLALVALQMLNDGQQPLVSRDINSLEGVFKEALPKAYRLLELTEEFLAQKQAERDAKAAEYWASPEGKKRREEALARMNKLRKPND